MLIIDLNFTWHSQKDFTSNFILIATTILHYGSLNKLNLWFQGIFIGEKYPFKRGDLSWQLTGMTWSLFIIDLYVCVKFSDLQICLNFSYYNYLIKHNRQVDTFTSAICIKCHNLRSTSNYCTVGSIKKISPKSFWSVIYKRIENYKLVK